MPVPPSLSAGPGLAGTADPAPAFELKAAAFTLPVIRLLDLDMEAVEAQLQPKVEQAPGFFRNTPVVIDLAALAGVDDDVGFPQLVGLLRGLGMIPVGVRGGSSGQNEAAQAMELAVLSEDHGSRRRSDAAEAAMHDVPPPSAGPAIAGGMADAARAKAATGDSGPAEASPSRGSLLIDHPIRSGQRVYAAGGDLTIVAPVSSGAELMADGNIHIYAPLRGRVIAGLKGDTQARIFCQDLQAELVSVAGHYRVSENIPPELKGRRVQVFLDHEVLRIEPM
ncbi:septum site-determining protein MinC [Thiohalocapsa marina]|uniref:Probable septum site-determining protein MinC n=1 Tax=Thiohalocapsa marina TaxID=424902 RepID=A0A5M8FN41_9GAMM|nr:septum site-determining protein MinC [Thiohalocapsa marina]KAA6184551.1 septum site-determining protein MinC [Thiohalocapsa marina]